MVSCHLPLAQPSLYSLLALFYLFTAKEEVAMKVLNDKEVKEVSGGYYMPFRIQICMRINGEKVCWYKNAGDPPLRWHRAD